MSPGRESDAVIAQALGFIANRDKKFVCPLCESTHFGSGMGNIGCHGEGCRWQGSWDDIAWPAYTTDIAAAWQVVEKMLQRGVIDGLYPAYDGDKFLHWCCVTDIDGNRQGHTADTAPLAICRAALAATR